MTSPLDDDGARAGGSDAPDAFSPDLQPLPYVPEKVTIRKKDRAKYSQEEEQIVEGESKNGNNIQEEGSDIAKPVKFGSNIATFKWMEGKIDYNHQ